MTVNDNYIVTFDNEEHKAYVDLLMEYGFDVIVGASMKVDFKFSHPTKGHIVILELDEDHDRDQNYEPKLLIHARRNHDGRKVDFAEYDLPMYPDHYTGTEWQWLQGDNPTLLEMLRRELYIWFKVRPNTMNQMKRVDTTANQ